MVNMAKTIIDVINNLEDEQFIELFKLIQDTDLNKLIERLKIESEHSTDDKEKEEIARTIEAIEILGRTFKTEKRVYV